MCAESDDPSQHDGDRKGGPLTAASSAPFDDPPDPTWICQGEDSWHVGWGDPPDDLTCPHCGARVVVQEHRD